MSGFEVKICKKCKIEKSLIDNTNTFQVSSEFGSTSITVGNKY